jgi:hypothetical protein
VVSIQEIEQRVVEIQRERHDEERAHGLEDDLYREFIAYVATLESPIAAKARLVLSTKQIQFPRHCS